MEKRKVLIDFYNFLEKEGEFPNKAGWANLWVDKYLKSINTEVKIKKKNNKICGN